MAEGMSRRQLLRATGIGVAAGAATGVGGASAASLVGGSGSDAVPFHGAHQAGIATPVQDRLHFAAFDVVTDSRAELAQLLRDWTAAAARMTQGRPAGDPLPGIALAPPEDTGEALGLSPSRLTLTIGFGPTLFHDGARDRFGLARHRPPALVDLPAFSGDNLDSARSDGDIAIQACADDPQVAVHAIRNLARIGFGVVAVRWSQLGFGKTSSTTPDAETPRNLFGFKDGTNNISVDDVAALNRHVWAGRGDGPAWMTGGSYLVARRIRMDIEPWDRTALRDQESTFGRGKGEGAPFGQSREHDPVLLRRMPPDSHVHLSHPDSNDGMRMLRRGYSFTDGTDDLGRLEAGLFFLAYQRDPRRQFIPLQTKLATNDRMSEYVEHVGSSIWACPPGTRPGSFWGEDLFA